MNEIRRFSAAVSSETYGLVAIGGESDSKTRHSSIENLVGKTWKELPGNLPKISRHCAASLGGNDIYIIGGHLEDKPFSDEVFLISMKANITRTAPPMKYGRQFHSCAKFGQDKIIVVGGRNYQGLLSSVEVFNTRAYLWTEPTQLQLQFGISHAQLIPDLTGYLWILCYLLCKKLVNDY